LIFDILFSCFLYGRQQSFARPTAASGWGMEFMVRLVGEAAAVTAGALAWWPLPV
jgi:hypothetical protein